MRHGDTESTAYGFGTFASRSMVMSGGAVARASRMVRDKIERIGAHLLQCEPGAVRCADGAVIGPQGRSVSIAEIARVALSAHGRPAGRGRAAARSDDDLRARHQHRRLSPMRRMAPSSRSIRRPARSSSSISPSPRIAARWSTR